MYRIFKITSHPTVDFAAEELKKYLRMMMPRCGEIIIERDDKATEGFRLGLMSDFGLDVSEADDIVLDDIIHIDTDENGGIIAGSNPRSVLLAVYRYLQENGCRWLFPGIDGEFIPIKDIEPTKYHKMADCRFRGQCNEGAEFQPNMMEVIDFTPKIGMNVFMIEFFNPKGYYKSYYNHNYNPAREAEPVTPETVLQWKRQCEAEITKRGLQFHDMGHGWTADPFGIDSLHKSGEELTIPEESLQYMAMTNGKRGFFKDIKRPFDTNICMSNPKAREISINAIVDYAKNHSNVDFLHVWLADQYNNHCECEECQKKTPSDWYVIMMNELDEALTRAELDTRIVFICYVDTSWPPLEDKLVNPRRFSLLVAPISRNYTEAAKPDVSDITYPPYKRNRNELFKDVNQYIKVGNEWQDICNVRALLYEYHFYIHQYLDPGVFDFARVVYDDIVNYKKNGLNGLINDCSQRSFFPNGFAFYIYGQLQFDTSLAFDELKEDYFSHAYGEDWREVEEILKKLGKAMSYKYLEGYRTANTAIGRWYNPAVADELRQVPAIAEEAKAFLEAHKNMPMRAQTVAYRLFILYMEYCVGLSKCLIPKCYGAGDEAKAMFLDFLADFGRHEVAIERYFDQHMMGYAYSAKVFNRKELGVPTVEGNN